MRLRAALLAASVLGAPLAAKAQPFNGVYIGAGAGYNYLENTDVRPSLALGTPNLQLSGTNGYVGLGSIGYGFGNGLRLETEGDFRSAPIRRFTGTFFPTTSGGKTQTYGVMAMPCSTWISGSRGCTRIWEWVPVTAGPI